MKLALLSLAAFLIGSVPVGQIIAHTRGIDLQKVGSHDEKEKYTLLLDLLTPVAKTYPSEMGILSISQGLQCLGGSGYCDDYPLEQYYRDARIHPIHEGTTGIHGIDLLGRKVLMKNGKASELYLAEVRAAVEEGLKFPRLEPHARELSAALDKLTGVTSHLVGISQRKGPEHLLADATLYLELFGIVSIAGQWLVQAIATEKALMKQLPTGEESFYK